MDDNKDNKYDDEAVSDLMDSPHIDDEADSTPDVEDDGIADENSLEGEDNEDVQLDSEEDDIEDDGETENAAEIDEDAPVEGAVPVGSQGCGSTR